MKETKTELGMRLYDTAVPEISIARAAALAGIRPPTLWEALGRRERIVPLICPTCHRFPGQRPAHGQARTGKRRETIDSPGSVYRALGLPEQPTAHTTSTPPPRTPRPGSPPPVRESAHHTPASDSDRPPESQPEG